MLLLGNPSSHRPWTHCQSGSVPYLGARLTWFPLNATLNRHPLSNGPSASTGLDLRSLIGAAKNAHDMDDSQEPLISEERRDDDFARDSDTLRRKAHDQAGLGTFVLLLTFAAGISGLLFGCMFCDSEERLVQMLMIAFLLQTTLASSPRPWSPSARRCPAESSPRSTSPSLHPQRPFLRCSRRPYPRYLPIVSGGDG